MGKIYQATAKTEKEMKKSAPALNGYANGKNQTHSIDKPAERFDFLSYSLNPRQTLVLDEQANEPVKPPAPPPALRQVELNSGRLDSHLVTFNDYDPVAAEQYHRLAAALIAAALERPLKRVLIASALHGDGRTCVTLNLAAALAHAQRRVLIVDADLARPSVLRLLGVELEEGLSAAREGYELLELLPYGFDVLPSRRQPANAAGLLALPDFKQQLDEFDRHHDFILFDSAPLLAAGDAHLLLHFVDTALLIVSPNKCSASQAAQAIAPIPPEDIFGVVLNRAVN